MGAILRERMNKKLKIILAVTKSNFGGAQKYVYDLAINLPKDKYEVVVLFGGSGFLKNRLESENIRTISLTSLNRDINIWDEIGVFFSLLKILKREKPDIFHVNSSKIAGLGTLAARLTNVRKVIFTVHGWAFFEERAFLSKLLIKFLSYLTVLLSDTTITVSEADYKATEKWLIRRHKLIRIHNGISPLLFLSREEARQELRLSETDIVIGSIGELTGNKNYANLIPIMSQLGEKEDNLKLFIIGEGENRNEISEKAKKSGLLDKVILTGFRDEAYKYLKAYDVFILNSLKEGLPYVLLEAGMAGLPVIASDVGGVSEIIEDKKTGFLFSKNNKDDLYNLLLNYLQNKESYLEVGIALKEKVENEFSFAKMIEKTLNIYTR